MICPDCKQELTRAWIEHDSLFVCVWLCDCLYAKAKSPQEVAAQMGSEYKVVTEG